MDKYIKDKKEKIFRRSRWKDFVVFFISFVFLVLSFSTVEKDIYMGYVGVLFFGLIAAAFLIQLVINGAYLRLNDEGFEERTLFTRKKFRWKDVSNFEVRSFRLIDRIHFDHRDNFGNNSWKSIISSYTISSEDLLYLMKEYRNT